MRAGRAQLARLVAGASLIALAASFATSVGGPPSFVPVARAADPAHPPAVDPPVPVAVPPSPVLPAAPVVLWHGPRTARVVALTFDDGWNPAILRSIVRVLVREHVPATFFVTGIYVQRDPALWRRIARTGFPLANHSYLHRDTRDLSPDKAAADMALTRRAVESVTGIAMLPAFRPPYGARTATTDREAAAAGFPYVVMWDVSAGDTGRRPSVAGVVRSATGGRPGSVVLLHAGPRVTPRALAKIIARYRARGFGFVTLPDLLHIPTTGLGGQAADRARAADAVPRALDIADDDPGPAASPRPAGGHVVPLPTAQPATLAAAAAIAPPPPARAAAWARRDGTPEAIAIGTVVLLVVLFIVAAIAGRGVAAGDTRA